ncbi:DUF5047 domain-containing protein [Streptomyces sp. NPDC001268]|uniref:DUF5047 domain-containing protein n=1 Tax=Streptomyces sp. NPDC001268 TaxID=3364553 RepID=UPI0036A62C98
MYTVTQRFLDTIVQSHTPVTEVTLFRADGVVETLPHTGGSVTVDRGQQCRRTCSVTIDDVSLIPRTARDKLSVYGAQLRIARGVDYGNGEQELVPVGVFRLDEVGGDVDEGPVTLQGKSLECIVSDDKFTQPYKATGTAVGAVTALIQRSIPGATVLTGSTVVDAAIGPRTFDVNADPWTAVTEVAAAIGAEVYANADGEFVIAELPDLLTTTPVWTIAAGEGGAYMQAVRSMSATNVYNGILARGENSETNTAPVQALVVDSDPNSPTYWDGPFGHRPDFYSSSTLTTTGQCTAAATLKLRAAQAPNASADITALPNPALEAGDVLRVVYPDGSAELHQAHSFPIDLGTDGGFVIKTISAKEGT